MIKLGIALVTAAILGSAMGVPAQAHHYSRDTCGEVGLWDEQNRVAYKEAAYTIESHVSVANIPPYRICDANSSATWATQHNSLHARSKDGAQCIETVAQRYSDGTITMWGYNCSNFNDGGTTHSIPSYGHDQMVMWMSSGGGTSTTWSLWYWRFDTNQWVFLANVGNKNTKLVPWAESSGYNASSVRQTWFNGYKGTNEFGSWMVPFSCGVSQIYLENHQAQVTTATGSVAYEANGSTRCR
ncbi:MAG TPA: hypothetical protein VEU29_03125 [Actinomycetota bacterium]|nr:hypothetical protein [Actinomycetota bacterium]